MTPEEKRVLIERIRDEEAERGRVWECPHHFDCDGLDCGVRL